MVHPFCYKIKYKKYFSRFVYNQLGGKGSTKDLANFLKQAKLPLVTDQQKKFYIPEYNLRVKQPLPNN